MFVFVVFIFFALRFLFAFVMSRPEKREAEKRSAPFSKLKLEFKPWCLREWKGERRRANWTLSVRRELCGRKWWLCVRLENCRRKEESKKIYRRSERTHKKRQSRNQRVDWDQNAPTLCWENLDQNEVHHEIDEFSIFSNSPLNRICDELQRISP